MRTPKYDTIQAHIAGCFAAIQVAFGLSVFYRNFFFISFAITGAMFLSRQTIIRPVVCRYFIAKCSALKKKTARRGFDVRVSIGKGLRQCIQRRRSRVKKNSNMVQVQAPL